MERNDIVVLENLQQEDDQPRYLVVLAKEIENYAADGSSYDYSLENNDSECEYDMMKAIEKKFGINTAELSLCGEDNELEACIDSEISDELLAEINTFAKKWRKENEWFDNPLYWNYFDGSNWKSELLYSEEECANNNRQYDLLDSNDDTAKEVIAAYDRAEDVQRQWENGYSTFIDEETGYEIRFSQWYGHASMADVY
nr:MAG TPA: hypothetical protein [Caudoviricetes sp.]